jgi:hypothetical protein
MQDDVMAEIKAAAAAEEAARKQVTCAHAFPARNTNFMPRGRG